MAIDEVGQELGFTDVVLRIRWGGLSHAATLDTIRLIGREVLPALASEGELYAFHHEGFWKSMDTYKESLDLTAMCRPGPAPQRTWR